MTGAKRSKSGDSKKNTVAEFSMPSSADEVECAQDGWQDKDPRCTANVWLCYANLALYSMCYWTQVNVLPFLIKEYGGGMKEFAIVSTVFSVIQTIGSLYYGRIADKFGYKSALFIATVASASSYFCLGQATSLTLIVASKIPCVAQHAYQGSQTVIACCTSKVTRPTAMARLNIAYGIGMIAGPKLGGIVQEAMKEHATANVAGWCSVVSLLLIWFMSNPSRSDTELPAMKCDGSASAAKPQSQLPFLSMLRLPGVALLLIIKNAATLPGQAPPHLTAQAQAHVFQAHRCRVSSPCCCRPWAPALSGPSLALAPYLPLSPISL
jgi:MFS family permease